MTNDQLEIIVLCIPVVLTILCTTAIIIFGDVTKNPTTSLTKYPPPHYIKRQIPMFKSETTTVVKPKRGRNAKTKKTSVSSKKNTKRKK